MRMVEVENEQIENGSNEMNRVLSLMVGFKERLHDMTALAHESAQSVEGQTASVQEISALLAYISAMASENKNYAHEVARHMDIQHKNVEQMLKVNEAIEKHQMNYKP